MPSTASPIKALIFDFDGVLADTEPLHWQAWREILKPYGIELNWEIFQRICVGLSDWEMLNELCKLATRPVTPDELRVHYPRKRKLFRALAERQPVIDPALIDLLKSISSIRLGVVTSSNEEEIRPILLQAKLLDCMTAVVYGNHVQHYKPHPEPYHIALQRLGVAAEEAVVFEDSAAGMQSAREAGCRVVQVVDVASVPALVRAEVAEIFPPQSYSYGYTPPK
ncbi:MAG: HAD family hydrolase [Bryobacteraceae bacterium]